VVWRYDGLPTTFTYGVSGTVDAQGNPGNMQGGGPGQVASPFVANGPLVFTTNEVKAFEIRTDTAFVNAVVPVEGATGSPGQGQMSLSGDYQAFGSGFSVTPTLSRASGESLVLTMTATGAGYISGLQLRADPIITIGSVQVKGADTTSQAIHGICSYTLDAPWMDENTANTVVDLILNEYANPPASAEITFISGETENTRLSNMLEREPGEKVTIQDAAGWSDTAYIDTIDHEITEAGMFVETTFTCRKAVTPLVASANIFILDSSTNAVLDTDLLAY